MVFRAAAMLMAITSAAALAQQPTPLVPTPDQPAQTVPPGQPLSPRPLCRQPLPHRRPRLGRAASSAARPSPTVLVDPASGAQPYRPFLGIWSDAAWTPQLCAALIVENVGSDGTATITYAFGPIGSGKAKPGGVLHGTGIIADGELKFQNADGSQYGFKPFYSDLGGQWTTPQGETYEAIFKKTF